MKTWRLKKGADRRIRHGHPWVFTGEVAHSTREVEPGEIVELRDSQDHFLAYGYAHPKAQICFRKLTGVEKERDVLSVEFFLRKLRAAYDHRKAAGWHEFSHRWLNAEADGVPGLVVDAYYSNAHSWIVVVQASTAGMERVRPNIFEALDALGSSRGGFTIVEAPSSKARAFEGLPVREKSMVSGVISEVYDGTLQFMDGVTMRVDLIHGQKTGFFLDQQWNISLLKKAVRNFVKKPNEEFRVLDLCCYVGQWSTHIGSALVETGHRVQTTLVDSSESALSFAKHNASLFSADVKPVCADVLEVLGQMDEAAYDVVISDPPAFVKKKADLEAGLRAYRKLNKEALKRLRPGGLFVASSCSGLVKAEDWREVLAEASLRSGRPIRQLFAGGHGPDHPVRPQFPEGEYLKCIIAR
ncbi:MAG: class I SAM-dependent rRNA methyltransferase [Bdellovibrionales bacterium]